MENGNLEKKIQPYAADKLQRFGHIADVTRGKEEIGPGTYEPDLKK